ncbi:MAG TPA: M48 family metalloprotease [Vicinamibacterales bacterium]|jgi:Zn-dependent protease with chaperone function|nr:M48 family metalloprotease [Vicinamibacterales bacterium]
MAWHLSRRTSVVGLTLLLGAVALGAQTVIVAPDNKYTPAEDVQLGREAAVQVEQQLPILREADVTSWLESVGGRLVAKIPAKFRHSEFRYSFKVVNAGEINAFALPGGPSFVNRGMISQSRTQGEAVSVLAHEISHVALRHGTAQATKATKYEIGTLAGAVLGSIIGGKWGGVVAQGSEIALGTHFLKFSREYERQADLLGSHLMAAAGYDPREMASMFKIIQSQGSSGGPEWLSSHPDPGNRSDAIAKEAALLRIENPVRDTRAYQAARTRLSGLAPAPAPRTDGGASGGGTGGGGTTGGTLDPGRVAAPATSSTSYTQGDLFSVSVPSNWRELPGNDSVTFAPDGAVGEVQGQGVVTHGMIISAQAGESRDIAAATEAFIASLASSNPSLRRDTGYTRASLGGREWLRTTLSNRSAGTNPNTNNDERIAVFSLLLEDGTLFYALGIAPQDRFSSYDATFRRVVGSIRFLR